MSVTKSTLNIYNLIILDMRDRLYVTIGGVVMTITDANDFDKK